MDPMKTIIYGFQPFKEHIEKQYYTKHIWILTSVSVEYLRTLDQAALGTLMPC